LPLGRPATELTRAGQEVQLLLLLLANNRELYEIPLARALLNASQLLSRAGQHMLALDPARASARIHLRLVRKYPVALLAKYTESATCLSDVLFEVGWQLFLTGHASDALPLTQDAVAVRRAFAEGEPAQQQADLAAALHDLGRIQARLGDGSAAIDALGQALAIGLQIAKENPATLTPYLQSQASELGQMLSSAGRHEQALLVLEHAVDIARQLTTKKRDTESQARLATALDEYSRGLATTRQPANVTRAIQAMQEASELRKQLARIPDHQ
jgi:tetratricopeptide (TPR) repeat protein